MIHRVPGFRGHVGMTIESHNETIAGERFVSLTIDSGGLTRIAVVHRTDLRDALADVLEDETELGRMRKELRRANEALAQAEHALQVSRAEVAGKATACERLRLDLAEARADNGAKAAEVQRLSVCLVESKRLADELRALGSGAPPPAGEGTPIPLLLWCPECYERHIDEGEFASKPHKTHACQKCGFQWAPAVVPTVGVRFLPGCAPCGVNWTLSGSLAYTEV